MSREMGDHTMMLSNHGQGGGWSFAVVEALGLFAGDLPPTGWSRSPSARRRHTLYFKPGTELRLLGCSPGDFACGVDNGLRQVLIGR
jgi:hypothetical protein